jgi:hypothetical protein
MGDPIEHFIAVHSECCAPSRKVRDWIGYDARDKRPGELPRDCAIALGEVPARSIEARPVPWSCARHTKHRCTSKS